MAFDYFPDAPKAKVDWSQEVPVLPVVPSTLPDIEAKLSSILAKLEKLPLEAIGGDVTRALASLDQTLKGADTLVKRVDDRVVPALNTTLDEARRVIATADGMLKNELNSALAEARRVLGTADGTLKNELNGTLAEVRRAVATANTVLANTDATLLGKDAPGQQELRDALQEVTRAARSLRVLTDYLERHPESLIRGKIEGKANPDAPSSPPSSRSSAPSSPSSPAALHADVALLHAQRGRRPRPRRHPTCRWRWARCRCRPRSTGPRSSSARARTRCGWTSSTSGRRRWRTTSRAWSPRTSSRCSARRA